MEDKAEKQSWLGIENGTKFPLWAAWKTFSKVKFLIKREFLENFPKPTHGIGGENLELQYNIVYNMCLLI